MMLTYASFYRERFITVLSDTSDGVRIFVHHWPSTHRHYLFFSLHSLGITLSPAVSLWVSEVRQIS